MMRVNNIFTVYCMFRRFGDRTGATFGKQLRIIRKGRAMSRLFHLTCYKTALIVINTMPYRSELDGLRALAVLPVVLFHAGFAGFGGGFVGVDVFFVISGYLITQLLVSEAAGNGRIDLIHFYERRARRLLPALFCVLLACLPFAWLWLRPADTLAFTNSVLAVIGFVSNILFWHTDNYFDTATALRPLLHTWSLAIEEQFYLLFPLLLMLVLPMGMRAFVLCCTILALSSLLLAQYASSHWPSAAFYLLHTRSWELLVGSFVALYARHRPVPLREGLTAELCGWAGLLLLAVAVAGFNDQLPWPSAYTLVPVLGAALLILGASSATRVGRGLGHPVLVSVGLISYSVYLWHQPLFAFARLRGADGTETLLFATLVLVTLVLGWLTWRFVEQPFRQRNRFTRRQVFAAAATGGLFFVVIGVAGQVTDGFAFRTLHEQQRLLHFSQYPYATLYQEGRCFLKPEQAYTEFAAQCAPNQPGGLLLWGDSHAAALSHGIQHELQQTGRPPASLYAASGCPPLLNTVISWRPHCKAVNDFVLEQIKQQTPAQIVLHANWSLYSEQDPIKTLEATVRTLHVAAPEAQITVVGSVPHWNPSLPQVLLNRQVGLDQTLWLDTRPVSALRALDDQLRELTLKQGGQFVSALDAFCRGDACLAVLEHEGNFEPTAWDYGHLTAGGSEYLAHKVLPELSARD